MKIRDFRFFCVINTSWDGFFVYTRSNPAHHSSTKALPAKHDDDDEREKKLNPFTGGCIVKSATRKCKSQAGLFFHFSSSVNILNDSITGS